MSVPRTLIGHSFAAAGALDTITTLLTLRDQLIPATQQREPMYLPSLRLVRPKLQSFNGSYALIGGRSLSSSNSVLVVRKYAG
jgi:3-oxoacyl-(acyl-carrier-protein) synthase